MTQPVKLSEDLVLEARLTAEILKRSTAEQIEFWASLGRALEPLLQGDQVLALQKDGRIRPLSECLRSVDTLEGRRRVAAYLEQKPFPHYEPAPGREGCLVRIEKNARRTIGRFAGRQFQDAD